MVFWLDIKFESLLITRKAGPLILDSFIIVIALSLNVLNPFMLIITCHMDDLNIDSISKMYLMRNQGKK